MTLLPLKLKTIKINLFGLRITITARRQKDVLMQQVEPKIPWDALKSEVMRVIPGDTEEEKLIVERTVELLHQQIDLLMENAVVED